MEITGATGFVSGANGGLGRVIVEILLERGAEGVYAGARQPESLEPVLALSPERVVAVQLDITDTDSVAAGAAAAQDVDLLVNNAGVCGLGHPMAADPAEIELEMATNFWGPYAMIRAFAPVIEANGGGAIVNVLSMAGLSAIPPIAGYSASKAAAHSLTETARAELRPRGISVHGAYPVGIGTPMLLSEEIPHSEPREVAEGIVAGVEAEEEDIFPCGLSRAEGELYMADPKELERRHTSGRI
jgi:NAD(P)-dependent dehydrogenase (short-subunit alcohol dehydrogenase family)